MRVIYVIHIDISLEGSLDIGSAVAEIWQGVVGIRNRTVLGMVTQCLDEERLGWRGNHVFVFLSVKILIRLYIGTKVQILADASGEVNSVGIRPFDIYFCV